jgi:hypothetical protein
MHFPVAVATIRELDATAATPREAVAVGVVAFVDLAVAVIVAPVAQLARFGIARPARAVHALLPEALTRVVSLVCEVHVAANEQRLRIDHHGACR